MRILVTEPLDDAGLILLRQQATVDVRLNLPREELLRRAGDYEAIITRSGTPVDRALLDAGTALRVIGRAGIGVDNIDIPAATERGIAVVNAPNGNVRAAAEHTIGMIFALARNIPQADHLLRQGVWGKNKFMGTEISGKTVGIIGLGKVGTQVARRMGAFDMEVLAYDPFRAQEAEGVTFTTLDDLLARADIVTLHVPLTAITRNMIGERELALMKPDALLINVARGKVVDEAALVAACRAGHLGGAALDVFAKEPFDNPALLDLHNVILTPHLGGTTHESMRASAIEVAEEVLAVLAGRTPQNICNPEVLTRGLWPAPAPRLLNGWLGFQTVVLDCDSTLTQIEGVDELAAMRGCREEVATLTRQAMAGELPMEAVFESRLERIQPTQADMARLGELYSATLAEDAAQVVAALRVVGLDIVVVSGGFRQALEPLADTLGLCRCKVRANELHFDENGGYAGFDRTNPLWQAGGKATVVRELAPTRRGVLLAGDGATDAEARHAAELFVGLGGVANHETVRRTADVYIKCKSLAPLLVLAAGRDGCERLLQHPDYRDLVIKGLGLLVRGGCVEWKDEYAAFGLKVRRYALEGI
ncbi:MAG TPA: HAD-IB family phosphatase [Chloroflexia bacterium]|jgi:phosphoserine phosphatase SerB|nr:HAD-IB family phosphatase [Chloroflexia bacterium]